MFIISEAEKEERVFYTKSVLDVIFPKKDEDELYKEISDFFRKIVDSILNSVSDIVVFASPNSHHLYQVFIPLICNHEEMLKLRDKDYDYEFLQAHIKSFSKDKTKIKISVVEVYCSNFYSIEECIEHLCDTCGIAQKNIYIYSYAVLGTNENKNCFAQIGDKKFLQLKNKNSSEELGLHFSNNEFIFLDDNINYSQFYSLSRGIITIIHMNSFPYFSMHSPCYLMNYDDINFLFSNDLMLHDSNSPLKQEDLAGDLSNPDYFTFYDLSAPLMYENDLESFVIFPKKIEDFTPNSNIFSLCFHFHINKNLKTVTFLPFILFNHDDIIFKTMSNDLFYSFYYDFCYTIAEKFLQKFLISPQKYQILYNQFIKTKKLQENLSSEKNNLNIFDEEFQNIFKHELLNLLSSTSIVFRNIADKYGKDFIGIPLKILIEKLESLEINRNRITRIILFLVNSGELMLFFNKNKDILELYVTYDEQICHTIYNAQPSYACFLRYLFGAKREFFDEKYFNDVIHKITNHFNEKNEEGIQTHLPVDILIQPLKDMRDKWNNEDYNPLPFFAPPFSKRTDSSENFFAELEMEIWRKEDFR